ncbi:MAG: class I SAM-dependent methyltransferase [Anaerolineae bacterium]
MGMRAHGIGLRKESEFTRARRLRAALWSIYDRTQPASPEEAECHLPWSDPDFSERMLREHLDQSHGAASRAQAEIDRQLEAMWEWLRLRPGARVLDVTCGPGLYAVPLAARGCEVHGIDFSPASIRYARELASREGVEHRCRFTLADVREALPGEAGAGYDAALFLYGQLAVFTREEASSLLRSIAAALRPGGRLLVELLNYDRLDRTPHSSWWFTDRGGLWGDFPYLHLGERDWLEAEQVAVERFYIIDLESGELHRYGLIDHAYPVEEMTRRCQEAGFASVQVIRAWGDVELYDADEWVVYIAERGT